ncbi:hypothetical protein CPB86DRAFT_734551 [Serendipita vermifera]|nr:hypothetical protein CPB86DRAFT_734551 [Serendipita vermifera]
MPQASLLQDVLRQQLEAVEDAQRRSAATATSPTSSTSDLPSPLSPPRHISALLSPPDSDDDEPIDVMSGAATPLRSVSITRSSSPTRAHHRTHKPSPLAQSALGFQVGEGTSANQGSAATRVGSSHDPMRMLPDKVRTMIFCLLGSADLANCTLTCQRWKKSQTINHAWYQLYRTETYQGSDLPVGKWTKRESKRDWRLELMRSRRNNNKESASWSALSTYSRPRSGASTPRTATTTADGYLTPKEMKEEEWSKQVETSPSKNELRTWYKEKGGKRVKKPKTGMTGGMRDRTAWED